MIEKTINQKLATRKETRGEASEYFFEPFNIDKKLIIASGVDLKEEDISISGYKKYQYMNFIFTNVMSSNNFEQFVMSMCILRQEASKKLGFDDEFDWVNQVSSYYFIDRETYMDPNSGRILKRYEPLFPKKSDIPLSEVPKVEEMREKALNCLRARITL